MAYKSARVDVPLTEMSIKYRPEGFIGRMVLTSLPAKNWTGIIPSYGDAHLQLLNTRLRDRGEYHLVNSVDRSLETTYSVDNHGLRDIVSERDYEEIKSPFRPRADVVDGLSTLLEIEQEHAAQSLLRANATYTAATNIKTLTGNAQWDSGNVASDPLGDFRDAQAAIFAGGHMRANCAIIPYEVYLALRYHTQLAGIYGQSGIFSEMEVNQLKRVLALDKILIPMAGYVTGGTETSLWGKDVILSHVSPRPRRMQRSFGYMVYKKGHDRRVFVKETPNAINSDTVFNDTSYTYLITHKDSGYLIKNAIS